MPTLFYAIATNQRTSIMATRLSIEFNHPRHGIFKCEITVDSPEDARVQLGLPPSYKLQFIDGVVYATPPGDLATDIGTVIPTTAGKDYSL